MTSRHDDDRRWMLDELAAVGQLREAKATIGRPELRVHDLRHTAASVWLASGADPKVVQRVLGHASAAMTLDVYSGLFDDDLDGVAQRLDQECYPVVTRLTRAEVIEFRPSR
jgi:integrase